MSMVSGILFLCFLAMAVVELFLDGRRFRRARLVVLAFVLLTFVVLTVGALLVLETGLCSGAGWRKTAISVAGLFSAGGLQAIVAAFFLAAALNLPRSGGAPRLLPLADLSRAKRRRGCELLISVEKIVEGFLWLCAILAYSWAWLWLVGRWGVEARVPEELRDAFRPSPELPMQIASMIVLVLVAPFCEEAVFRGYVQDRLRLFWRFIFEDGSREWLARASSIALASLIWATAHGQLDPAWVKWGQIFGIGLILGVVRLRLGLEVCILLHLIFNIVGGFLLPEGVIQEG